MMTDKGIAEKTVLDIRRCPRKNTQPKKNSYCAWSTCAVKKVSPNPGVRKAWILTCTTLGPRNSWRQPIVAM